MNIFLPCNYTGYLREEFKKKGHFAVSCDLLPSEIPGLHIQGNCLDYLGGAWEFDCGILEPLSNDPGLHYCKGKHCFFRKIKWDMMVAYGPPCTYLADVGNGHFKNNPERLKKREEAFVFFMALWNAPIEKKCIENPKSGFINKNFRQPDTIINPYYFGGTERKRTCLWTENLPPLVPTVALFKVPKPKYFIKAGRKKAGQAVHFVESNGGKSKVRGRSFKEICEAMADQWG